MNRKGRLVSLWRRADEWKLMSRLLLFPVLESGANISWKEEMKNIEDLKKHILSTYVHLRFGLAGFAIALPFFLWFYGGVRHGIPLQGSMSAYYHVQGGALRDEFVGVLIMVAAFLYLYKGFTKLENIALNLAGLLLAIVALFPMPWDCKPDCGSLSFHGAAAVLFFVAIAYVCLFRANDTLPLMKDREKARRFAKVYKGLGVAMVASPIIALVLVVLFRETPQDKNPWIFFVEAVGVVVFGIYWLFKSFEITHTHSEERALHGDLRAMQTEASDLFKALPVEPAE